MGATGPKVAFPAPDLPLEVVQLVFSATDSEGEDVLSLGDRARGMVVCTAWRLALDPSAWPLRQCALTASAAPGHVDPVAEWLHRVRTGVRRLAVGSARPGEVAPFNSPSVQAAHRAFLSLRPRQALRELELCLGSGALRGFWSALCALPALERLTLRADKGEPFVLDAQKLAALPTVRELALSSFSAVRLVAGGAADGSDASSAGAPTALLPRLERLSVAGSEWLELNGPLPALRALSATGCGEVMVGGPALELPSLSDLSVQAHGAVEAWGSRLPALERLELAGVGTLQARDYTRLTRLSHLSLRQLDASTLVADIALSMLRLAPPTLRSLALHFGDYRATEGRIVRRLAPALRGLSQVTRLHTSSAQLIPELGALKDLKELCLEGLCAGDLSLEHVDRLADTPSLARLRFVCKCMADEESKRRRLQVLRRALPECVVEQP